MSQPTSIVTRFWKQESDKTTPLWCLASLGLEIGIRFYALHLLSVAFYADRDPFSLGTLYTSNIIIGQCMILHFVVYILYMLMTHPI